MSDWPERLNRFIEALREGRQPEQGLARSPEELEELRLASRIAGLRPGFAEPDPVFLARLRDRLAITTPAPFGRLRRSGLLRAAGALIAGLLGGIGIDRVWLTIQRSRPRPGPVGQQGMGIAVGQWYPVAFLTDLSPGAVKAVDAGAVPAFLVRDGETIRALSRVCTHMGCLLRFDPVERELRCPCHGAAFDLAGRVDPDYDVFALPPLPSLDVRITNGVIYVRGA